MNLQKLLLIATMPVLAVSASAQFHASVRMGAAATTFGEQEIKLGLRGGINAEYQFSDRWGLRSGLFYTMKGATTSKNVLCYNPQRTTKLSYLDIPVEAQVSFSLSSKTSLSVHGGPYFAYKIYSSSPENVDYTIRSMDVGVGFGVDLIIGHFVLTPEVQYGLTSVTKPGSTHNASYALTLGYRF